MNGRIYPVPVKRPSGINTWTSWPDDVREVLRKWNQRRGLTFIRSPWCVFKCCDCEAFCEAHGCGAAVLRSTWLCDDCLISRARQPEIRAGVTRLITIDRLIDRVWHQAAMERVYGGGVMGRR